MSDERAEWEALLATPGWRRLVSYIGKRYGADSLMQKAADDSTALCPDEFDRFGLAMVRRLERAGAAGEILRYPEARVKALKVTES